MSFISVAAGQPIRATHVQQFTNWLTAQKLDTPGTIACTSTTEYALTVRAQDLGTGLAMAVQYGSSGSPLTLATFNKAAITLAAPVRVTGTSAFVLPQLASTPATAGASMVGFYAKTDATLAYQVGTAATEYQLLANPLTATGDMIYSSSGTTAARLALGTKGYALLADTSGPKYEPLARRNRVTNGSMRVKQRSTLGTTDDSYTLDCWNLLLESAAGWAVTQETSDVPTDGSKRALKLTADGNDTKGGVATYLEFLDIADLRGKTVSLQAKLKVSNARIGDVRMAVMEWTSTADSVTSDVVSTWEGAGTNPTLATNWVYLGIPANLSVTTSWATYKVENLTVGTSANNLAVFIWIDDKSNDSGDHLLVTDVQLEEGSICTQFERLPYQQDLANCQRYYYRYASEPIGLAYTITILTTDNCQLLPVPMRTSPSISGATFAVNAGSAGTVAATAASNRVLRFYNSDSNWTVNALVSVTADVSAEL